MERRKTQEFVTGEDAEDQNALIVFEAQIPGFPVLGQHALTGAQTEQSAVSDTHCCQDNLPILDPSTVSNVLGKGSKNTQHCGSTSFKAEKDVKQEVIEEESTSQRVFQSTEISGCNTGTLEEQQIEKRPKFLVIKVKEERTISGCQIRTTSMRNIIIKNIDIQIYRYTYSINYILHK